MPRLARIAVCACLIASLMWLSPFEPSAQAEDGTAVVLGENEVVTFGQQASSIELVVGSIVINQPAERIWPILANPFEFKEFITPSLKSVTVLKDTPNSSLMTCTARPGLFLPSFQYTVASTYDPGKKISFQSTAGDLKDFRGTWEVRPVTSGSCRIVYSMYVEPGLPVPQWLVRQLLRMELPKILIALRKRIDLVYGQNLPLVSQYLVASRVHASL